MSQWTLFSNHGHVLLFLARDPDARLRDVAEAVGITERAVQKIVRDLQDGSVISVIKKGRRNRYRINGRKPLRHELEAHRTVGNLVKLMKEDPRPEAPSEPRKEEPVPVQERKEEVPLAAATPEPAPLPPVPKEEDPVKPVADEPVEPVSREEPAEKEAPKKPARKKVTKKSSADEQQGSLF